MNQWMKDTDCSWSVHACVNSTCIYLLVPEKQFDFKAERNRFILGGKTNKVKSCGAWSVGGTRAHLGWV